MKKFLSYVLTFVLLLVISAAVTINLNSAGNNIGLQLENEQTNAFSAFSGILDAFEKHKQFSVQGAIDLSNGNTDISVDIYLDADIVEKSNMKFNGQVAIGISGNKHVIKFSYFNNNVYLTYNNNSFILRSATMKDVVDLVKDLLPETESKESSKELDTNSLMQELMSALGNMEQTEHEDGSKTIHVNYKDMLDVTLSTDSEEKPTQLVAEVTDFEGFDASVNVGIEFDEGIIVNNPEKIHPEREYIDVDMFVKAIDNTLSMKKLKVNGMVDYKGECYNANILFDLENKVYQANVLDLLSATFEKDNLFVDLAGAKLLLRTSLFENLKGGVMSQKAMNSIVSSEKVKDILSLVKQIDASTIIKSIENFSIANDGIRLTINGAELGIENINVFLNLENGKINSLEIDTKLNGEKLSAVVSLEATDQTIEIEKDKYLDIEKLYNSNIEFFKNQKLAIKLGAEFEGEKSLSLDGNVLLDLANDYYNVNFNVLMGQEFNARLIKDQANIFAAINEIRVRANDEQIGEVLKMFNISTEVNTAEAETKIKELAKTLSLETIASKLGMVKEFEITNAGLKLVLAGELFNQTSDIAVALELENERVKKLTLSSLEVGGGTLSLYIDIKNNDFEKTAVREKDYLDIFELYSNLENLELKKGSVFANAKVNYAGKEYNASISFKGSESQNRLAFVISIKELGVDIDAELIDGELYVKFNNMLVKAPMNMLEGMLGGVDLGGANDTINKLKKIQVVRNVINNLKDLKIEKLAMLKDVVVTSSTIQFSVSKELFGSENDAWFAINIYNGEISSLSVVGLEIEKDLSISFSASLYYAEPNFARVDEDAYLDISALIENIQAIDFTKGSVNASASVHYNGKTYEADVAFKGSKDRARVSASVELSNALNLSAKVELIDGNLYLKLQNIYIKLPTTLFGAKLGGTTNINSGDIKAKLENLEIVKKLKNIFANFNIEMLKELKDITINANKVELTIGKDLLGTANDIHLSLSIANNQLANVVIENLELDYNLSISITADLNFNEPTFADIENEENYLDYNKLVDGIYSLLESQNLALTGKVNVLLSDGYDMQFALDIKRKVLGSELMGMAIINLFAGTDSLSISSLLANNTIYASYNGLNIKINKDDISSTVNRVCSLLGIEKSAYEKYLTVINNILAGDRLDIAVRNIFEIKTLGANISSVGAQSIDISLDDIVEILNNIQINSKLIDIELGSKITKMSDKLIVKIVLENYMLSSAKLSGLEIDRNLIKFDLAFSYEEQTIEKVSEEDESKYIDLYQLAKVGEAVYHTLETGSISGKFALNFEFMGEKESVDVAYSIKLENKKLVANLTTTFKGLYIVIDIVDNTFYLNIEGLKVYLAFNNITDLVDFINSEFKTNITIADEIEAKLDELKQNKGKKKSLSEIIHSIATLDLAFVKNATYGENTLEANFVGGVKVFVAYGEEIEKVEFTTDTIFVELQCLDFSDAHIPPIDKSGYEPYTIIISTYKDIKKTLAQKQFLATANATSYKGGKVADKADVNVALDIENAIKASGHIAVSGTKSMDLDVKYQNKTLYVNYNSLKVKMVENSIQKLLFIALDLVGLQPETIGFLKKAGESLDFSNESFSGAMKLSSPLKYLTYIAGLELEEIKENDVSKTLLSVHLHGEKIYSKGTEDMRLEITISDAGVEKIQLFNIYTGNGDEYFNFTLIFGTLENFKVEDVVDEGYLDISPSPDLINGLINSAGLKEYYITGKVNLSLNGDFFKFFEKFFGSLVKLNITGSVKVDEKGKPTVAIQIDNFPILSGATAANSNGGGLTRKRAMSIYYKDDMIYLRTDDQKTLIHSQYIRETRVPISYFMSNFEYYLNWLFGFESLISNKIHEAILKAQSAPIDYTNLIEAYEFANGRHKITINSHALTHDESNSLGSIIVGLSTSEYQLTKSNEKEVADTEARHYIHALDIEAELLGLMTLNTNDNDRLFLNLNKTNEEQAKFDQIIKDAESYMSSYSGNPYKEFVKEGSGSTNPDPDHNETFTITLDSNGGSAVSALTGSKGDKIVLPTPTKVFDDMSTKRIEYKFVGWKIKGTDKFFGKDEYFHENLELIAEWEVESEKSYYRVTYDKNGGGANYGVRVLEGTAVSLDNLTRAYFDNLNTSDEIRYHIDYSFEGWTLDGEIVSSLLMPSKDIVLVAKWNENKRYYRTLKFNVNSPYSLENPASITKLEGEQIVLESLNNIKEPIADEENCFIVKEFANWFYFDGERKVVLGAGDKFTFEKDVTMFAEYREIERIIMKRLIIIDPLASEPLFDGLMTAGKDLDFGEFTSQIVKDPATTQFYTAYNAETKSYSFNALYPNWIMPENDLTLYVRNMYTINLTAKGDHGEFSVSDTQKRYQDELVPLMNVASCEKTYYASTANTARWTYTLASWQDEEGNVVTAESTMPNHDISLTAKFNIFTEYCIYYDTTFYRPSDIYSWPTIVKDATSIGAVWVAAGTKNYDVTAKKSQIIVKYAGQKTYYASWSTTKPYDKNLLGRNVNNGKETIISTIASVDQAYYLYAVWKR